MYQEPELVNQVLAFIEREHRAIIIDVKEGLNWFTYYIEGEEIPQADGEFHVVMEKIVSNVMAIKIVIP